MLSLRLLHPSVGAEITGLDLTAADGQATEEVRAALLEHPVIAFRDQGLGPAELAAVARCFGEPERFPTPPSLPGHPEVCRLTNQGADRDASPTYWHTDGMYQPEPPTLTLLYAAEVPRQGGETLFFDSRAAYVTLPEELRNRIERLTAVLPNGVEKPLVRRHPTTRRKALLLDLGKTVGVKGLERDEAVALFRELRAHCEQPERVYRHRYQPGDLVIWDNAAAAHSATEPPPSDQLRVMLRSTVRGGPVA